MKTLDQIAEEIKLLGYYQLIGGIIGIGLIVYGLINTSSQSQSGMGQIILLTIMSLPFIFSIYAGNQCINKKSNRLLISKINQSLQVISFALGGFGFTYHSGIFFSVGVDASSDFFFEFNFGISTMSFDIGTASDASFAAVNIIALYLVYRILGYEDFIDNEHEKNENKGLALTDHLISKE